MLHFAQKTRNNMGILGSKSAIDAMAKKNKEYLESEEGQAEQARLDEIFDRNRTCSSNGTFCLKDCKFQEGGQCQRLLNKQKPKNE